MSSWRYFNALFYAWMNYHSSILRILSYIYKTDSRTKNCLTRHSEPNVLVANQAMDTI